MEPSIDIIQIVNSSMLQQLPDAFYDATGIATGIQNLQGELITALPRSSFSTFCRNMFFSKKGHACCLDSNKCGAKRAFEIGGPYIYYCHAGLIDVAAPIVINGTHVGSVTCGQILIDKPDPSHKNRVRSLLSTFPTELVDRQVQALDEVTVLPRKRVEAIATLLHSIASEVVDLIIAAMREKEIRLQNARIIDEMKARNELEKEVKNAQIRLKEAELKALQAQINPHFLYNTLDSIQWLSVIHGVEDIQKITYSLGQLLRQTINQKSSVTTLRAEIEHIGNYLFIQKVRYGDKLSYHINVEPEVLDYQVPRATLQPLVENAILHGLDPKAGPGSVWINAWLEASQEALVEVVDDGVGFSDDRLRETLQRMNEDGVDGGRSSPHGMGLSNVHRRLEFYFGQDHGLEISRNGDITTVRFSVPYVFDPERFSHVR